MRQFNLGIDFDGVITDPTQLKIDWIQQHCGVELRPEQTVKRIATQIIGKDAYQEMIKQIYAGDWALRNRIRPEAVAALRQLMVQGHRVFIITSRTDEEFEKARILLERNNVPYTDLYNTSEQPKVDVCRTCGIHIFLDDSVSKLEPLRVLSEIVLVFFNCLGITEDQQFDEVSGWQEFVELVRRKATP